jgi:hypothetical protein
MSVPYAYEIVLTSMAVGLAAGILASLAMLGFNGLMRLGPEMEAQG